MMLERLSRKLHSYYSKAKRMLVSGPTVLLYHRVAQLPVDPHLLAVAPENFAQQMQVLRSDFRLVSLSVMIDELAQGKRLQDTVAVTFDDGYADNFTTALPILKDAGVPATFYLSSGFVGLQVEQLQDDLERILLLSPNRPSVIEVTIEGMPRAWSLHDVAAPNPSRELQARFDVTTKDDSSPVFRCYRELHAILRAQPPKVRQVVLNQLRQVTGVQEQARDTHRGMTWEEVRQMSNCHLVEVGAHTINHPWLSNLTKEEQAREIAGSKDVIEQQSGQIIRSFAYPYGTRESYTQETVDLVKGAGFVSACSNFRSPLNKNTDFLQIPRFVVRDWDGREFLRRVKSARL